MARFRYADYAQSSPEFRSSKDGYRPLVHLFEGRRRVVDLGCGDGVFLDLLSEAGIDGLGIEADEGMLAQARAKGHRVLQGDLVDVLRRETGAFDAAFCAHVVEHMGFEAVLDLVEAVRDRLEPNGLLVLVFPNPGNLDMQLRWFWRDPEHVRFYGGDLIAAVLRHYGFTILEQGTRHWKDDVGSPARGAQGTPRGRTLGGFRWRMRELIRGKLGISAMESEVQYLREIRGRGEDVLIVTARPGP